MQYFWGLFIPQVDEAVNCLLRPRRRSPMAGWQDPAPQSSCACWSLISMRSDRRASPSLMPLCGAQAGLAGREDLMGHAVFRCTRAHLLQGYPSAKLRNEMKTSRLKGNPGYDFVLAEISHDRVFSAQNGIKVEGHLACALAEDHKNIFR